MWKPKSHGKTCGFSQEYMPLLWLVGPFNAGNTFSSLKLGQTVLGKRPHVFALDVHNVLIAQFATVFLLHSSPVRCRNRMAQVRQGGSDERVKQWNNFLKINIDRNLELCLCWHCKPLFRAGAGSCICYNLWNLQKDYVIIGSSEIRGRLMGLPWPPIVRLLHTSTWTIVTPHLVLIILLFHTSSVAHWPSNSPCCSPPRRHELPEGVVLIISPQHLVQRQRTWRWHHRSVKSKVWVKIGYSWWLIL